MGPLPVDLPARRSIVTKATRCPLSVSLGWDLLSTSLRLSLGQFVLKLRILLRIARTQRVDCLRAHFQSFSVSFLTTRFSLIRGRGSNQSSSYRWRLEFCSLDSSSGSSVCGADGDFRPPPTCCTSASLAQMAYQSRKPSQLKPCSLAETRQNLVNRFRISARVFLQDIQCSYSGDLFRVGGMVSTHMQCNKCFDSLDSVMRFLSSCP